MVGKRFSWLRESAGYTVIEALTVVGAMGVVAAATAPSVTRFKATQEVQAATSQVGGMLQKVRARATSEAIPYLVLFQQEEVVDGVRSAFALIVRDNDRSYSVTPPDDVETFALDAALRLEVRQYGEADGDPIYAEMVAPTADTSTRIDNSGQGSMSSDSGSSGSGSSGSGSGETISFVTTDTDRLADRVTNGTTFAISEAADLPAIAFNERGIPVSLDSPQDWGTGAGSVYLTDNENAVYAAVLSPLGEVSLTRYDATTETWK